MTAPQDAAEALTEEDLVRILVQEAADASSYHDSELAKNQEEALRRYFAEPYGTEKPGRATVVSHDIEDAINWIMPDLMRCFASAEDLVSMKAQAREDDQPYPIGQNPDGTPRISTKSKADIIAAYLSHIYFEDNAGLANTHDFAFDGLLQRIGVMKVAWEDPEPGPPMLVEGVGLEQLQRYATDPEYEILGHDVEEGGQEGPIFVLELRRTPRMGRVHVEAVPPEEFAIEKLAKSVEAAKYHRRRRPAYLAELIRKYPEKADDLRDRRGASDDELATDGRRQARFPDDNIDLIDTAASDEARRQVMLDEEYIRIDFDGDGIVELRHVKRVGKVVIENIAVSGSDYVVWTPSRVSHKAIGRSLYDMLADYQRIRTEITRTYLDALSGTLSPRTYVNTQRIGQDGLDALAENELGGIIPINGVPQEAVQEATMPDVSGAALTALEYFDQRGQEASGVTKHSQGLDPQALNKTATGIDLLQAAAKTRVEMIARWLGLGLEDVFKRILQLVVAHQDKPRQVKLFGEWCEVDPRRWSDEMAVAINVGSAGVSRQQRLANLALIAAKQEQVLVNAGPSNPLVTLQHYRNTLAAMTAAMGFRDAGLFFGDVPEGAGQQQEPPPDPKLIEVQQKGQLEQAKAQHAAQLAEHKVASEREIAMIKAESERQIAEMRMTMELQIARERMAMESELAREKAQLDFELAERDSTRRAEVGTLALKATNGTGKSGLSANRPGGDLSQ